MAAQLSLTPVHAAPEDQAIRIESANPSATKTPGSGSVIDIDLRQSRPSTTRPAAESRRRSVPAAKPEVRQVSSENKPTTRTIAAQPNEESSASTVSAETALSTSTAETTSPADSGQKEAAPATTSSALSRYRTAPTEEIETEIKRLRQSAERLPAGSPERRDVEELIESHQLRLQTGVPVQELVAEITAKVSELRGLKVKEPVRFRMMDRKELRDLLEYHIKKDYPGESLENSEFVLKLVGAIPDRVDLRRTILSLLSEQVAGLYDPESKLLYVMKEFDLNRSLARIILAHEIGHALQDQHYNLLSLPITQIHNADRQLSAQAVIEGDATLLMQDYAAETMTMSKLPELLDAFLIDQKALDRAPYFLQRQLIFPYMGGADFLQSMILKKGDAIREEAFQTPPDSTEQILHPDKYLGSDHDDPTSITLPDLTPKLGDGWTSVTENEFGEFQIKTLFEAWREWEVAPRVADGWDGDRFTLYRRGDDFLFVWLTHWDSKDDAADFFEFFSELMRMKRYKEHFEEAEFPESGDVRRLPVTLNSAGSNAPVHLRFHLAGKQVVVAIANSAEPIRLLELAEESVLKAANPKK